MPLTTRHGYQRVDSGDTEAIEIVSSDTECQTPVETEQPLATETQASTSDDIPANNTSAISSNPEQLDSSPPPYVEDGTVYEVNLGDLDPSPPKYGDVVKLPTYEEIDLNHTVDFDDDDQLSEDLQNEATRRIEEFNLGTDLHFIFSFFISFFFNVIGLLFIYCLSTTMAGRHGALAGFGLSLVKTAFLFKYTVSNETTGAWPGFFFVVCGVTIMVHGICSYIRAKRSVRPTAPIFLEAFMWRNTEDPENRTP